MTTPINGKDVAPTDETPRPGLTFSGIYSIQNVRNGKQYVGSAIDLWRRWRLHRNQLNKGVHHSRTLQRSWAKHGSCAFSFRVIERVDDKNLLLVREQHWIDTLKTYEPRNGYNISPTAASSLGIKRSREFVRRMSEVRSGIPLSENHKENVRKSGVYERNRIRYTGRRLSQETRTKLREINLGNTVSEETRDKIRKAHTGRKRTEESRGRMRLAQQKRAVEIAVISSRTSRETGLKGRKGSVWITAFEETKTLPAWMIDPRCRVPESLLRHRIASGWNPEQAITQPPNPRLARRGKSSVWITAFGETKRLPEWLIDERCKVADTLLRYRIRAGWPPERAITESPEPRRKISKQCQI